MCLALGIDDPEAWLDSVDERTIAIWEAYYQIEPFGNQWQQTASLLSMLSVSQALQAATGGHKMKPLPPIDFMPHDSLGWAKRTKQKKRGIADGHIQKTFILASFGFRA